MRDVSLLFGADMNHRTADSRGRRLTCIDCLNQSSMNPIDESTGGSFFGNRLRRKAWWRIRSTAPCSRAWLTSVAYKMTAASAVDRPCLRCGPDDPVARRRASSGPVPFWTARAVVLTVLLCYADLFRGQEETAVSCEATKHRIPCVYLRRTTASLSLCRAVDRRGVNSILVVRRRPLCAWREERARFETRRQSQRGRWKRLWEPPDSCLTAERR